VLFGGRRLVLVHQENGPTIEGILVHKGTQWLRLTAPKVIAAEDQTQSLDGDVEIPRERVVFVQLLAKGG
jgi:hypothetical protein